MEVYASCADCGIEIKEGERYWTIEYHEEVMVGNTVTVLDADAIYYYCPKCAKMHDFYGVVVPMK